MPRSRSYRPKPHIGTQAMTLERDAVVLAMRREGVSQAEIARRMSISQSTVAKAIQRGLRDLEEETAAKARGIERLRYDWLEKVLVETVQGRYYMVNNGRVMLDPTDVEMRPLEDPKPRIEAAGVLIRLWERRAKLLGLDTPIKQVVRHEHEVDADIERILAELAHRREADAAGEAHRRAYPDGPPALEGPRPAEAAAPGRPEAPPA